MLDTVTVPEQFEPIFRKAQEYVSTYFSQKKEDASTGKIEVFGQRYILVRAASMSVDFFDTIKGMFKDWGEEKASEMARSLLFDVAHTIGKMDARNFHQRMGLKDPIEKLSAGPIHFSHTGWAFVDISAESKPTADENYYLIYEHPFSFEADAWEKSGKKSSFCVCTMNAGYSSGWCEESFGIPLVASEIMCKARGDSACRFIMAHPSKMAQHLQAYLRSHPEISDNATLYRTGGFFQERKKAEEETQRSYDIQTVINRLLSLSLENITLHDMLERALDQIVSISWLSLDSKGAIFLVEDEPEVLVMKAQQGIHPALQAKCARVPFGQCLCGRAALSGEIVFAQCVDERHENRYEGISPHGHYCVPILSAGKVLGVINTYVSEGHRCDRKEEKFLRAVADVVAGIIERKRMEESLRDSEGRFRAIFDNANDGILLADTETRKFYFGNKTIYQMLGYNEEEIKGLGVMDLHPQEALPYVIEQFEKQSRREIALTKDLPVKRKDGSVFYADVNSSLITLAGRKYLIGVFRDVTERKKAEETMEKLNKNLQATVEELTQSNKELEEFVHIASHDLKTPLRGITTLAKWLSADYADKLGEQGREQIGLLLIRVERMYNLIEGILQYSRIGRVKENPAVINLNKLIPEIINTLAPPANISVTVENELPTIKSEPTRIAQVFQNLMSNAIKYMDKPQGQIKVGCVEENGFWKFDVTDNGPGIGEKYFEKIFQIFQTLAPRDDFESTGIGLAIVKKIVELYGGRVWVESRPREGSTFFFTLPKKEMGVKNAKLKADIACGR